jgi:hypothetical protein
VERSLRRAGVEMSFEAEHFAPVLGRNPALRASCPAKIPIIALNQRTMLPSRRLRSEIVSAWSSFDLPCGFCAFGSISLAVARRIFWKSVR